MSADEEEEEGEEEGGGGRMKYVIVTGGVVSGLGKGVTASSIGVVLKGCGLRVTSIKIGASVLLMNLTQGARLCCVRIPRSLDSDLRLLSHSISCAALSSKMPNSPLCVGSAPLASHCPELFRSLTAPCSYALCRVCRPLPQHRCRDHVSIRARRSVRPR